MKKFLSIALSLALILSLSTVAFAQNVWEVGDTQGTPDSITDVRFTVESTYTVKIPAEITLTKDADVTGTVEYENVLIQSNEQLQVSIIETSDPDGDAYIVTNEQGNELTYTVSNPSGAVVVNTPFLTVNSAANGGADGTVDLTFGGPTTAAITYVGNYSGTLTFQVEVVEV